MVRKQELMMHVQFDVPVSKLSLFTELLENEVHNLKMEQVTDGAFAKKKAPDTRNAGVPNSYLGKPNAKASPSFDAILGLMKRLGVGGQLETSLEGNAAKALADAGMNRNSASSIISRLNRDKYLRMVKMGLYEIIKIPGEK